jgi:tRNA(Ile)-lysidine synthase
LILVAASGGIDSTVLLHVLAGLAPRHRLELSVGHVNHGLRGAESDAEERFVAALADKLGLECHHASVAPRSLQQGRSNRDKPTLQEAARQLRYDALLRMADACGAAHVATAHNRDDQAETVLMRLFRGTGPSGLGAIPERSADGRVVRLLLDVSRERIAAFASEQGLDWCEDSSNEQDAYTRNRLRHHWLPELAREFNPQLARTLSRHAEAQRRDAEWIESLVDDAARRWLVVTSGGEALELRREGWGDLPEALARRLVQRALARMGCARDASRVHIERVLQFVRGFDTRDCGSTLELPGGLRLRQERTGFVLRRTRAEG